MAVGVFCFYLLIMRLVLVNVTGSILDAPKLRDERELTAYITGMQRAQLQVSVSVVCSHTESGKYQRRRPARCSCGRL